MTFREWLRYQEKRDHPIGDLARDARRPSPHNPRFPRVYAGRPGGREKILEYLAKCMACDAAVETFEEAWVEYLDWEFRNIGGRKPKRDVYGNDIPTLPTST